MRAAARSSWHASSITGCVVEEKFDKPFLNALVSYTMGNYDYRRQRIMIEVHSYLPWPKGLSIDVLAGDLRYREDLSRYNGPKD